MRHAIDKGNRMSQGNRMSENVVIMFILLLIWLKYFQILSDFELLPKISILSYLIRIVIVNLQVPLDWNLEKNHMFNH